MSDDLVLYGNPRSRAQMARWMLEEVGRPYRSVMLDFEKREHKTPEFLKVNPMGKVPALTHGDTVVTETGAIIAYLADAFPEANLAPAATDPRRGAYYRWLFFGAGVFEPALLEQMLKRPEVDASMKGAVGWGTYDEAVAALKAAVSPGPYLLGDRFTAADLYIGAQLDWARMFGAPGLTGPEFDGYVARVTDRDAYRRANAQA